MSTDTTTDRRALAVFLTGKTIAGLRCDEGTGPLTGLDLCFTDGSELELYALAAGLGWVPMTAEEIAAEDARDAELLRLAKQAAVADGTLTFTELVAAVEQARDETLDLPPPLSE